MEKRIENVKMRKLMGLKTVSWVKQKLRMQAKQSKKFIYYFPLAGQGLSHFQESTAPSHITVTGKDKCCNSKHPPFLFLPSAFIGEHDTIWYGISFDQPRSAVPAVSPPSFVCTPASSLVGWCEKQQWA